MGLYDDKIRSLDTPPGGDDAVPSEAEESAARIGERIHEAGGGGQPTSEAEDRAHDLNHHEHAGDDDHDGPESEAEHYATDISDRLANGQGDDDYDQDGQTDAEAAAEDMDDDDDDGDDDD